MRKFWSKNETAAVIAITETATGEAEAVRRGYSRIRQADMTSYQRRCIRDYNHNNPTIFPAQYLG